MFSDLDAGGSVGFDELVFFVVSGLTVLSAFADFPFLLSPDAVFFEILDFFICFCFFPLL